MTSPLRRLGDERGFTMIIAIGVMFVTSMILVAAFTVANGDIHNSQRDTGAKQAYYAAVAGIQQYEYELQAEPNFWQKCQKVESKLEAEEQEHIKYVVSPVPANKQSACSTSSPFSTMIESKGTYANTFRIRSTGYGPSETNKVARVSRTIIATFAVSGFLDYLWYTNFETEDPGIYRVFGGSNATLAKNCEGKHYDTWSKESLKCPEIEWNGDSIEGPFHTEDSPDVTGSAVFGRPKHEPVDPVEFHQKPHGGSESCSGSTYNTTSKCFETPGKELALPPEDTSLKFYIEESAEGAVQSGETWITLEGSKMTVKRYNEKGEIETKPGISYPPNGLIYVKRAASGCGLSSFNVETSDTSTEQTEAKGCGTVFVSGNYERSLTIAAEDDVIVSGNIYPTGLSLGSAPTNAAVLGLIANNYVRIYHPGTSCPGNPNYPGGGTDSTTREDRYVYAAVLATKHSWLVDNANCGSLMGKLRLYGALAQNYRGVVYRNGHGWEKAYVYDERLATDEPPYFLAPLKAGWKVVRQVAQNPG